MYESGRKDWYIKGQRHRVDAPAVEWTEEANEWYLNGLKHRENGPAVDFYGTKEWWLHGIRHRIDGPAIENTDGSKKWYVDGVLHRENGPAIEYKDGKKKWYLNNIFIVDSITVLDNIIKELLDKDTKDHSIDILKIDNEHHEDILSIFNIELREI